MLQRQLNYNPYTAKIFGSYIAGTYRREFPGLKRTLEERKKAKTREREVMQAIDDYIEQT